VYDRAGHLLGEYDQNGAALREYVWLRDTPMAMFTPDPVNPSGEPLVYFIHTDHLNTPRVVVDRQNRVRWRWLAEPFGTSAPETDPSGLGVFTQNLRFPGQYADQESGLFYNYARYYGPDGGRYTQSDPSGLAGGVNTYGYAEGNPLAYFDVDGNQASLAWCLGGPPGCAAGIGLAAATIWMATHTGQQSIPAGTTAEKKCCTVWRRFYTPNSGKHSTQGKWVRGNWWGPAPDDVQAAIALQTAIPVTADESVLVGAVGTQIVQFNMESQNEERCERIYHGFIVSDQPVNPRPDVNNVAKRNDLPGTKKWPWR
jgi:RHS repeat-associated protein